MPTRTVSPVQGGLTNAYSVAAERYRAVRQAHAKGAASCEQVNSAQRALDDALYDMANPPLNSPIESGRAR